MAEPTRGQLPAWTNSGWGRFLLSALDSQIPGNAFSTNWGSGAAPTHNFTNFREFTGLGGLQRGFSGFGNFLSNAGMYASNFRPSNLFDSNPHTGLFSGSNASPELWGPPNPYGQGQTPQPTPEMEGPPSPYTTSPGDPRQWSPFQGQQGNTMSAGQRFNASAPSHWRQAGRGGNGGNQNSGIGPFGNFMTEGGTIQRHDSIR